MNWQNTNPFNGRVAFMMFAACSQDPDVRAIESNSRYSINGEPSRSSKNSSSVESMHQRVKDLSLGNVQPPKIARNVVPVLGRYRGASVYSAVLMWMHSRLPAVAKSLAICP